jgi:hypothetical protein
LTDMDRSNQMARSFSLTFGSGNLLFLEAGILA